MATNLGNVVGLLRSEIAPSKKYILWGKILNPAFPDIVELNYWDDVVGAWTPVTDPTTQHWLRPVLDNSLFTPPAAPVEGDRYLVAAGGTGAWAAKDDQIASYRNATWVFQVPMDGFIVSVRTEANKLYDYRGTYGDGGAWVENDFQVPIAPGTYIPSTEKEQALGVATLDENTKVPQDQIDAANLLYAPASPNNWPAEINTIFKALDHLILTIGGSGAPIARSIVDTSGALVTLDMVEFTQLNFMGSDDINAPFTIAFARVVNAVQIPSFIFNLLTPQSITFPANVVMFDGRKVGNVWTPEEPGNYEFHFTYTGAEWFAWVNGPF